jgi:hypothetical protein
VGTTLTDLAGNAPLASRDSANYAIDTREPLAPVVAAISNDTGAAVDGVTSDTTLVISGTAEANTSVEVFINGGSIGTTTADGAGNWSFDHSGTALAPAGYTITAQATDAAGNSSLLSADFDITVDTAPPSTPTITSLSDDTGIADNITSDNQLVFAGTAEANSTVEVFLDGVSLGTIGADGSGNWTFDYSATTLADGTYTLTARATDLAGNTGVVSADFDFTVDATGPAATVSAISNDTGTPDNITSDATLVFSGTSEANNSVEVFIDGVSIGTTLADGSGNWTFDHTATTLADGSYVVTAQATDTLTVQAGAVSAGLSFTVDTVGPSAAVTAITNDTGAIDGITTDNRLEFSGTAEANNSVEVFRDTGTGPVSLGFVTADAAGNWTFDNTGTVLVDGIYRLSAQATDLATGQTGPVSSQFILQVDTTPPPNSAPAGSVSIDNTTPEQGDVLTASNDLSDADGLGAITYHWQRDTGSGFVDIGSTGNSYTATQDDVGATLRVEARYTDSRGFDEAVTSGATAAVANVDDAGTGDVSIDNLTPVQGDTLTASNTLDDPDGLSGTIAYQWQRDGVDIAGQNGTIYVTTQSDVGAVISVVASYVDDLGGTGSVASVSTAPVADLNDSPTGAVLISGSAAEDQTLTVSNTLADPDGVGTVSYQWQRDGVDISGATGTTYTLGQDDVGAQISVMASYIDGQSNPESMASDTTATVANVNDLPSGSLLSVPAASTPGTVLTINNDLLDEDGISGTVSFQWLRDGVSIAGATGNSYTLTDADMDSNVSVVASYTDDFGTSESLESAAFTVVRESSSPAPETPDGVNVPDERTNDDSGTPAPISPPAPEDPTVLPPEVELGDPVLDSDIGTGPVVEVAGDLDIGNRAGSGNNSFTIGDSSQVELDDSSEDAATIAAAERERELVEDLLQLIQDGDTEEDINLTAGVAGNVTLQAQEAEEEELAAVNDVLTNHALWDAIDRMNEEMALQSSDKLSREELVVQFVSTSGLGLFAALTVYALRGGALMASWLSTMPLWGNLDPLPILRDKKDEEKEKEKARDRKANNERKAESMFAGQEQA